MAGTKPEVVVAGVASIHSDQKEADESAVVGETLEPTTTKEQEYVTGAQFYTFFLALVTMTLMIALDATIMATAIPRITDDFHTIANVGWYGAAYLLANASLQPSTGKIYTFFPLKLTFCIFVALFELGSVVCAAANSSMMLVIGRAICGIGGSGLANGCLNLIGIATPPKQLPTIMGVMMSMFGLGQLIGPLIGGALTQHASWRWCFWINLPIGALSVATILLVRLPTQPAKPKITKENALQKFDVVGFLFFAPASVMLLLALQWGGLKFAWSSPTIIGLIVGSVVMYVIFIVWEYRQGEHAMFPSTILKQRVISSGIIFAFLFGGSLLVVAYYLPLWFQVIKHATPTNSAVYTLPIFISQILFAVVSGPISNRIGLFAPLAVFGAAVSAIGIGLMITFHESTTTGQWIGYQILTGVGRGFAFQQPINEVQAVLPKSQQPMGLALAIWAQFFGGSVMLALAQTAFSSLLKSAIMTYAPGIDPTVVIDAGATNFQYVIPRASVADVTLAYNDAVTKVFWLAAMSGAAATFVACGLRWKKIAPKEKKKKEEEAVKTEEVATEEGKHTTSPSMETTTAVPMPIPDPVPASVPVPMPVPALVAVEKEKQEVS